MNISMTRRLEIDAGHRLLKHESKCRHVHGHRYAFDITCEGPIDEVGRIIDFGKVKEVVGGWLDDALDHGFVAEQGDPIIPWLVDNGMKHYITPFPPTAENISGLVLENAARLLAPHGIRVTMVRCYETPNGWADAKE